MLDDDDLEHAVAYAIEAKYTAYSRTVVGGPLADFFQWVIDNREAIFEIIVKLLSVFAEPTHGN